MVDVIMHNNLFMYIYIRNIQHRAVCDTINAKWTENTMSIVEIGRTEGATRLDIFKIVKISPEVIYIVLTILE